MIFLKDVYEKDLPVIEMIRWKDLSLSRILHQFYGNYKNCLRLGAQTDRMCYKDLSRYFLGVKAAGYTTLWIRFVKMNFKFPEAPGHPNRVVAFDGTGIKASKRSEWRPIISVKRRKWIKVLIAVDFRDGEILDVVAADGTSGTTLFSKRMLRD